MQDRPKHVSGRHGRRVGWGRPSTQGRNPGNVPIFVDDGDDRFALRVISADEFFVAPAGRARMIRQRRRHGAETTVTVPRPRAAKPSHAVAAIRGQWARNKSSITSGVPSVVVFAEVSVGAVSVIRPPAPYVARRGDNRCRRSGRGIAWRFEGIRADRFRSHRPRSTLRSCAVASSGYARRAHASSGTETLASAAQFPA